MASSNKCKPVHDELINIFHTAHSILTCSSQSSKNSTSSVCCTAKNESFRATKHGSGHSVLTAFRNLKTPSESPFHEGKIVLRSKSLRALRCTFLAALLNSLRRSHSVRKINSSWDAQIFLVGPTPEERIFEGVE